MNTSVLLLILGLVARGFSSRLPTPRECGPRPFLCSYGVRTGVSGCNECLKGPGEECGGLFRGDDNCGDGLECIKIPPPFEGPVPPNQPGVCVHRAQNIPCGPRPFLCSYGVITGVSGCNECLKGPGEECGGPFRVGNCGDGLECQEPPPFEGSSKLDGVCVHRAPLDGNRGSSVEWSPLVNACIRGHNNRIEDNVFSIADCQILCENERSFTCRSVVLNDKRCVLSVADSDFFEYEQPCSQPNHGSGRIYSEIKVPTTPSGNCPWPGHGCTTGVGVYRNGQCPNGEHQHFDSGDIYANVCTCCVGDHRPVRQRHTRTDNVAEDVIAGGIVAAGGLGLGLGLLTIDAILGGL